MANLSFLGTVEANAGVDYSPIPSGEYLAQIVDSDMKATSNNSGQYLELTHKIIDGPYAGRLVWARLNLDNPNATTVQIATQHLSQIVYAVGFSVAPTDSSQLHNRPMLIRVEFLPAGSADKKGRVRDRDSNEIRGWKRIDAAQPASPAPSAASMAAAAPAQAQPAAAAAPPWKRSAA